MIFPFDICQSVCGGPSVLISFAANSLVGLIIIYCISLTWDGPQPSRYAVRTSSEMKSDGVSLCCLLRRTDRRGHGGLIAAWLMRTSRFEWLIVWLKCVEIHLAISPEPPSTPWHHPSSQFFRATLNDLIKCCRYRFKISLRLIEIETFKNVLPCFDLIQLGY